MPSVADIFSSVSLNLETGSFEVDAQKFAEAAGAKAGQSMSSAIGSKLKSVAGMLVGAGIGALASGVLSSANELDAATRQLQADTGMTADEAGIAEKAISGMFQTSLLGYSQIGDTLSAVINALHLTGAEADTTAAEFVKFEEATGTTATVVNDVRGVLDAWNMSASQSGLIMDAVVASHQQYGTVVTEDLGLLLKMAPALQAVNMGWQDGVALLDLFAKAGISTDRIPTALNTALKKVKTPEEFKQALVDIGTMTDRFAASQKAADLFGARVGPAMAEALARSHGDLSSFAIDMDAATGATDRAATAVESGFGAQATLILHQFKGALADVATSMGTTSDAILVAASLLGPRITMGLLAGLGGVGTLLIPKITGALTADVLPWMTTGTMIGTTIGSAMQLAMIAAVPLAIAGFLTTAQSEWKKQTTSWGLNVPDLFSGQGALAPNPGITPVGPQGLSPADQAKVAADYLAAGNKAGAAAATGVAIGFKDGTEAIVDLADRAGVDAGAAFGKGAASMQSSIAKDGQTLMDAWLHPIDLAKTKTELAGALHAKALVDGMNSGDPAVRGAAEQEAINILTYLDALKGPAFVAGQNAAWSMAAGIQTSMQAAPGLLAPILGPVISKIYDVFPTYQQQVAKLAVSPGTIAGNQQLADAIKLLGGGMDYTAGAAAGLSDAVKTQLSDAFDAAKTKATTFFDALHEKNLKAIQDTKDLANAQIDSQIKAVNAQVQNARDALQATQDAEQLASLRAAVVANPTDVDAQQSLINFLAQQNINRMESEAAAKVDALNAQKAANDTLATDQTTAEDTRYKAQTSAWDKEIKALQTQLDKHPVAWATMNAEILKLLKDAEAPYAAAGSKIGAAFTGGVTKASGGLINLPSIATTPKYTAASPVTASAAPAFALADGGALQPAIIRLEIGGRPLLDYVDQNLAYRRVRRT